jgi:hypothetical protein
MTLEEAMVEIWRQALVEGAGEVELDGQKFPVRETPRKRLREVDFVFEGQPPRKTVLETRKQKEVGPGLKEEFGGDLEAAAEAFDVVLVEFALATKNLGDNAGGAEDIGEIFLQEAVLVQEELEDFDRFSLGKLIVAVFEVLDQEG